MRQSTDPQSVSNTKPSDLLSIANPEIAKKINSVQKDNAASALSEKKPQPTLNTSALDNDIFKAIYALNIIRYVLGLSLIMLLSYSSINSDWSWMNKPNDPVLFYACGITLLVSAILFSYISKTKRIEFDWLVTVQFSNDVLLATLFTHSMNSINSNFLLLYFVVVASGSILLSQKRALGLASGTIILMFSEHFYSQSSGRDENLMDISFLATCAVTLLVLSFTVSYLAAKIRASEHKSFDPTIESIEEYLQREEANALRAALLQTNGNKTEAAKVVGLSFRSFRYKLSKFGIE